MKRAVAIVFSLVAWILVTAATPRPLAPPPPDLTGLVPFVSAPLDKPPVKLPVVAMPPLPIEMPAIPAAAPVRPVTAKPTATPPPPRPLPCVGAWTGAVGETLECGRVQFLSGDLTDAVQNLERAARADDRVEIGRAHV